MATFLADGNDTTRRTVLTRSNWQKPASSSAQEQKQWTVEITENKLEGKYSLESTDPRESEIRAHLRP